MRTRSPLVVACLSLAAALSIPRSALAGDGVSPAPAERLERPSSATTLALPSGLAESSGLTGAIVCSDVFAPDCPNRQPCPRPPSVCPSMWDYYTPVVPVGPSRTMYTTPVMPPTPWLLTQGEAETPMCGRLGFNVVRISDERTFTDNLGNRYEFDGEEQVLMLEIVSPRIESNVTGSCVVPFHIGASLSAHTNNFAWYEGLRNFVENDLFNASPEVRDSHTIGGREDSITDPTGERTVLLDSVEPLLKFQGIIKFPLPNPRVGRYNLEGGLTFGFCPPAFGTNSRSGNRYFQGDISLAGALPLSESFRLTGVANVAFPGESRTLADFGVDNNEVVAGGVMSLEWWTSEKFAMALGFTVNGPYTRDSGLPTDLTSFYVNFGVLWRPAPRLEFHALFSENPGGLIAVNGTPATDYTWDTQRDADFSVTLGTTFDF